MFQTYQTKLKNENIVLSNGKSIFSYVYFQHYSQDFGRLERKLFVDYYVRKKESNYLKKSYCAVYSLTARQYNSIKNQLDGRVKAKKELVKLYLEETTVKIKQTEELIKKKENQKDKDHQVLLKMKGNEPNFFKKVKQYRSLRNFIHQKKRKLHRMKMKVERWEKDQQNDIVRLCFGSKDLFQKQFHLKENEMNFQEWRRKWREARSSQFTFIGSKDETNGNQTCTYNLNHSLRIRVSTENEDEYGKYVVLPNITFPYGQEQIDKAKTPSIGYSKGKGNQTKYYRSLTSKFIRKGENWYLNMTVDVDMSQVQSTENNGCIGVDFNVNFLAVSEVDRFGNPLHSFTVPFTSYHVSSEQAKQSLSEALKVVVEYSLEKQKPIAFEKLDFKKKKQQLKLLSKKQAKMLSGFAYSTYKDMIESKCQKAGIPFTALNPAYTSQIGHHKFMKKYGLSSHGSAAMVIARRGLNFNKVEKVPMNHWLKKEKSEVLLETRKNQWKELTKQWKKYTFNQKIYLLNQIV